MRKNLWIYAGILGGGIGIIYAIRSILEKQIEEKKRMEEAKTFEEILRKKEEAFNRLRGKFFERNSRLLRVWNKWGNLIEKHAKSYNVPVTLLTSIITQESDGYEKAYRYEPSTNLSKYREWDKTKDPISGTTKMSEIVKVDIGMDGKIYGMIDIPTMKYTRNLTRDEIKWMANKVGMKKEYEHGEYEKVVNKLKETMKRIQANVGRSASYGLGQLMYETAVGVSGIKNLNPYKLFDPDFNISLMAKFLSDLYARHKNWRDVISLYNTGKTWGKSLYGIRYFKDVMSRILTDEELRISMA